MQISGKDNFENINFWLKKVAKTNTKLTYKKNIQPYLDEKPFF